MNAAAVPEIRVTPEPDPLTTPARDGRPLARTNLVQKGQRPPVTVYPRRQKAGRHFVLPGLFYWFLS